MSTAVSYSSFFKIGVSVPTKFGLVQHPIHLVQLIRASEKIRREFPEQPDATGYATSTGPGPCVEVLRFLEWSSLIDKNFDCRFTAMSYSYAAHTLQQ